MYRFGQKERTQSTLLSKKKNIQYGYFNVANKLMNDALHFSVGTCLSRGERNFERGRWRRRRRSFWRSWPRTSQRPCHESWFRHSDQESRASTSISPLQASESTEPNPDSLSALSRFLPASP